MADLRTTLSDRLRHSAALLSLMTCVTVLGQAPVAKTTLTEPPGPLLPQHFGALQQVPSGTDGTLAAGTDAATDAVLKEDGLLRASSSTYKRDGSSATVLVKAFQFMDVTGAQAAYTYLRKPQDRPAPQLGLGTDASLSGNGVLFRRDSTVVLTDMNSALRPADLSELAGVLPKVKGPAAMPPLLPTLLPGKGLDAYSVKYALGPLGYKAMGGVLPPEIVGFDKSAETVTAKYGRGGMLTMLLYPTPQIAGDHDRAIDAAIRQQAGSTPALRREGPLVLLATGTWPAGEAQKMVNGIHLRTEVSFDKPMPLEFHAEVAKTYSLLQSIAIFCGLGALAAIVLGLFLGGGRAAIRVLQGKPAATEPEFLRIDLRGSPGKPLTGREP